jgi:hypothetical protein
MTPHPAHQAPVALAEVLHLDDGHRIPPPSVFAWTENGWLDIAGTSPGSPFRASELPILEVNRPDEGGRPIGGWQRRGAWKDVRRRYLTNLRAARRDLC